MSVIKMDESNQNVQEVQQPPLTLNNMRSTVAQIMYVMAIILLTINIGLSLNYITIVLPLLLNGNAGLKIPQNYSSYLVSVTYLAIITGSVLIKILGKWGRKPLMIMSMMFIELSWIITYFAEDVWTLLLGRISVGLAVGLSISTHCAIAEACEPRLRGVLHTLTTATLALGGIIISSMGLLNNFRLIAFINIFFPLANIVYTCFIPESPLWLCTKGRYDEALKSLTWLRGWQCNDSVKLEFSKLKEYCLASTNGEQYVTPNKPDDIISGLDNPAFEDEDNQNVKQIGKTQVLIDCAMPQQGVDPVEQTCFRNPWRKWFGKVTKSYKVDNEGGNVGDKPHHCDNDNSGQYLKQSEDSVLDNIKYIFSKEMMKPTLILLVTAVYAGLTTNTIFRNYLPIIIQGISKDANYLIGQVVYTSSLTMGQLASSILLKYVGKRPLILYSMLSNVINSFCFAIYDIFKKEIHVQWPLFVIIFWSGYSNGSGPIALIFTIIGELFPVRGRLLGAGLTYNMACVFSFIITFIFPDIYIYIQFYQIILVYGIIYIGGYLYFNKFLIETEGKTLQQIKLDLEN